MNILYSLLLAAAVVAVLPGTLHAEDGRPMRSLIFLTTGEGVGGDIIGVDNDSLTVVDSLPRRIAKKDVSHIIVRRTRPKERGFVYGTLLTFAGLHLIVGKAEGQTAPYMHTGLYADRQSGQLDVSAVTIGLMMLGSMGIGGGVGLLVDNGDSYKEATIVPGTTEESQQAAWQQLLDWTKPQSRDEKLRLSLISASVSGPMQNQLLSDAHRSGLTRRMVWWFEDKLGGAIHTEMSHNVNMVRRLQAVYNVYPHVEAGVSVAWLGEPVVMAYGETGDWKAGTSRGVRQMLGGRGYYAVGLYNVGSYLHPDFDARLGCGVGFADLNYRLDAVFSRDSVGIVRESHSFHTSFEATAFSTVLLAELSYRLYDHLSLGVTADYAFTPLSRTIPGIDFINLPERKFTPSNGSIGLTLSMHF